MDFSNTSGIRSPFSPRVRQSITGRRTGLSSAKKSQNKYLQSAGLPNGDIIHKTPTTTIETYGMPLPVTVTETLTFASGEVTARLSPCGWCWLVAGRRILAWPREAAIPAGASPAAPGPAAARELTLPQTDLAHKADLVVLFYEDGAQMPSCIGVSPEGMVRYWSSVGQPAVYVDISAELAGQECERLTHRGDLLVLATTTCTLVLLTLTLQDGRPTVECRTLRPPSGWLGGIGRRMSVYLFGSMPTHVDTKLVGVVLLSDGPMVEEAGPDCGCIALVASGVVLQIWRGAELHEHNLRRALVDACARKHLCQGDLSSVEVTVLDVRGAGPDSLLLLIAVVNVARSTEMKYAIAQISIEDPTNPRVTSLPPLRYDARVQPLKLLPLNNCALLYTTHSLAICSMGSSDKVEYIDVSSEIDCILGAELCNGVPLLFSRKHGVLVLTTSDMPMTPSMCDSPMGSPCPSDMYDGNLSLYEIDPHEISRVTKDACGKLKTAFLFHVRRETSSCRALIEELFPGSERADCVVDRTVLSIAKEMLDDIPAGDPRWKTRGSGQQTNIALGSSAALQIAAQLRDKQRAFSLFVEFLRATGLWQRLSQVTKDNGDTIATQAALGELAEWLAIASTLHRLQQSQHNAVIDAAVHQVVCAENSDFEPDPEVQSALSSGALSPADVCFRRVSRVLRVLLAVCAHPVAAHSLPVVVTVLTEMHKCRSQWQSAWAHRPGEARRSPSPLLSALAQLHKRAVTQYGRNCPDANLRSQMLESAATLADLILTDAQYLQSSSHTQHLYENMRREAIKPFMEEGQVDRAAALAEKFRDFELLVEMCVKSNDLDRLYGYIDKYSNEGMSETAFAWLSEHGGKNSAQLIRSVGARYPDSLTRWLATTPQRDPLLALHHLSSKQYGKAAKVLANLAAEEVESVSRMTTTASLAKLCLIASEESQNQPSDTWNKVESRLALSEQHAALPRDIRTHNGLDTGDTRVVSPEEMVQMYIECESRSLTEYDYKKALDLTDFVPDMERRDDLRLKVWCACIIRDDWSNIRMDAPSDELQNKMFFRLIDLVHIMGGDLELLLPPVDDILVAPELAELVSDPRFHFIIKYGYECVDVTSNQIDS